jgi:hypothetical protein
VIPGDVGLRIGVGLPGFVPGPTPDQLVTFAREAEDLGFDSVWLPEHLLRPPSFHDHNWLEPLSTLAFIAGSSRRIRLGTAILVLPLRHPILLSKEIATIQHLTDGRLILGVGVGWSPNEFAAMDVAVDRRGVIADQRLDALSVLLNIKDAQTGRPESGPDIEPRLASPLQVWIGGGSQVAHKDSLEPPTIQPPVMQRILRGSGWLSRPTADLEQLKADWGQISLALVEAGRDLGDFLFVHKNYVHVVPNKSSHDALRIQLDHFRRFTGRSDPSYAKRVHFVGSTEDIIESANARIAAGARYLIFAGVTSEVSQLNYLRELVIPHLEVPVGGQSQRTP